jgi:hypothetical protein
MRASSRRFGVFRCPVYATFCGVLVFHTSTSPGGGRNRARDSSGPLVRVCCGETPRVCGICQIPPRVVTIMLNFSVELSNLTLGATDS